jgi:SAM-dependent methyltransferase
MPETLQERSERIAAEGIFLGGPTVDFERVGRLSFDVLLREGLRPGSRVLDFGCGALRVGYWLMRFLEPGCYYGIEPNSAMLQVGLDRLLEPDVVARAQAHFADNDDFDLSVFGVAFDYVLARSIWTHTSREQISTMLGSFAASSAPAGMLLATYHPATRMVKLGRRFPVLGVLATSTALGTFAPSISRLSRSASRAGYAGEQWVGRSHESDQVGVVRHSLGWIVQEAARHGLSARLAPHPIVNQQYWLKVTRTH